MIYYYLFSLYFFYILLLFTFSFFFFFNDTATTEIYTLSLHDALPIYPDPCAAQAAGRGVHRTHLAAVQAPARGAHGRCAAQHPGLHDLLGPRDRRLAAKQRHRRARAAQIGRAHV